MDFHSLTRRDLQTMCKKNKIPANLTNAAMADALLSLKSIEWDEEIKQILMPQSETIEQHGSSLLRSRRVATRSSDISGFSVGEINDKEEEMTKEALIEANQTPATAVRRSQRLHSAMSTRTCARTSTAAAGMGTSTAGTRTRKGKKEEAPAEAVDAVAVETPAPKRSRKKAVETPAQGVVARSSARPTRQSTRSLAESTKGTRVTRTMTNMMALDIDDDKGSTKKEAVEFNTNTNASEGSTEQELNSKTSEHKEILIEKSEAVEEKLNSNVSVEERVASLLCDELKDDVSDEKLVEEVTEIGSDREAALISEGEVAREKDESEVNQTTLADSPIMGLVSDVMPENDSVVRHLANARLSCCDAKKFDASVVQKEETDKVVTDDAPELVQNETADKERVDLKSMSLRKLKALYKDRLNELNSKKIAKKQSSMKNAEVVIA